MSGLHEKDSWPFGLGSPHPQKQQGAGSTGQNRTIERVRGGLAVSADHISLPWPCLIAPSFGHASTSSARQGNTTAAQYRHFIHFLYAQTSSTAHFLLLVWWCTGASEAAGKAEGQRHRGRRRGHYHAFASQLFRHEGGLINGDRAGWAITGILLRLSGA